MSVVPLLFIVFFALFLAQNCDPKCPTQFCNKGKCTCPDWLSGSDCSKPQSITWNSCTLKRENEEDSDVVEPVDSFQPLLHPFIPKPVIHKNILKAGAGADGSCEYTFVYVPLDYDTPPTWESKSLYLKVERATIPGATAQVWEIAGGPGQLSVNLFHQALVPFAQAYNSDVYTWNVRGGNIKLPGPFLPGDYANSTQLKKFYENVMKSDTTLMKTLPYLTTTNNARDIKFFVDLFNTKRQSLFLNGHSYGTYVANRFCQLFPGLATGVISDGTLLGPEFKLIDWDINGQKFFKYAVMEHCKKDSFCSSYLTGDPVTFVRDALAGLDTGACSDLVKEMGGSDTLKFYLANSGNDLTLPLVTLYRLKRCLFTDRSFFSSTQLLQQLAYGLQASIQALQNSYNSQIGDSTMNYFLSFHQKINELGRVPIPTLDQLKKELEDLPLGVYSPYQNNHYKLKNESASYYPWQVPDLKLDNGYGNDVKTKWLFISGELDRNTPILFTYEIVKNFANSAHFVIKNGGHTVGISSECGFRASASFFRSRGTETTFPECELPYSFKGTELAHRLGFTYAADLWNVMVFLPSLYFYLSVAGICALFLCLVTAPIAFYCLLCRKKPTTNEFFDETYNYGGDGGREPLLNMQ